MNPYARWTFFDPAPPRFAANTRLALRAQTVVFAPEGVIHGVANASRTEEVVLVFAYGGVPDKEAARIVFIDDTGNEYPPKGWDKE